MAPVTLPQGPRAAVPVEVNGDGKTDLVALVDTSDVAISGQAQVMLGNGDGTFTLGNKSNQLIFLGGEAVYMCAAELTGDDRVDLAISIVKGFPNPVVGGPTIFYWRVMLLRGDGAAGFEQPTLLLQSEAPASTAPALELGDVNADGAVDVILRDRFLSGVQALIGNGLGGFTPGPRLDTSSVTDMAVGDVNGDGRTDVAIAINGVIGKIVSWYVAGSGPSPVFSFQGTISINAIAGAPTGISLVDVDQDSLLDLVISAQRDPKFQVASQLGDVWVSRGLGRGTFETNPVQRNVGPAPTLANAHSDLNGDGFPDIAVLNQAAGPSVAATAEDGTSRMVFVGSSADTTGIIPGDLNNDGSADLVLLNESQRQVTVLINTTPYPPPTAVTGAARDITTRALTLTGTVGARLQPTRYHFEYGPTTGYGASTPDTAIPANRFSVPASASIADQYAGDTVHYRLVATNRFGTTNGPDQVAKTRGLVGSVRFRPRWAASVQLGQLELRDLPKRPGALRLRISAPGGQTTLTKRIRGSASRTRAQIRLPRTLRPGVYHVFVDGTDEAGAPLTHLERMVLPAPATGYARGVFREGDGGPIVKVVEFGRQSLLVQYDFLNEPTVPRRRLVQRCTGRTRIEDSSPRVYQKTLRFFMRGSEQLRRGRYTCTLYIGRRQTPVVRATIRVV